MMVYVFYKSDTSAALGALLIGSTVIFFSTFWRKSNWHKIIILLAIVVFLNTSFFLVWKSKNGEVVNSLQPRLWTWGSALAGFMEKPILGWGAENFPYVFDKYYNANHFGKETWFDRTHNILLEYLVAGGIILLLSYLLIFFFYFKYLFKIKGRGLEWNLFLVVPLVYLIQGLTLFETLPIYISLFLFLALFINYSLEFQGNQPEFKDTAYKIITPVALLTILLASLFFTSYLPLKKNKLTISASDTSGKPLEEIYSQFSKALVFYSPVGQEELKNSLFFTTYNIFSFIQKEKSPLGNNKEFIGNIITFNRQWFEKNRSNYFGVKNLYAFTSTLLKAFEITDDKKYLSEAKELVERGVKLAPSRLEFIKQQMIIARIEKDNQALKNLELKLNKLRPDIIHVVTESN